MAKKWEIALSLLEQLRSGRGDEYGKKVLEPDIVSFNAAINALAKAGKWEKALALLREVENNGGKVTVRAAIRYPY